MKKTLLSLVTIGAVLLFVMSVALAGTTPIHIDIEQGGDIDTGTNSQWDSNYENVNGAMFWNGSKWVTNDTAAHAYFTDLRTGGKLNEHNITNIDNSKLNTSLTDLWADYAEQVEVYNGEVVQYNADLAQYNADLAAYQLDANLPIPTPPTVPTQPNPPFGGQSMYDTVTTTVPAPPGYAITKTAYSYSIGAPDGSTYTYVAVEYKVAQPDGTTVVLKSRGSGNGESQAYFNVYVEDGKGNTTAMRGDPVWFNYSGMNADTAKGQMDGLSSSNVRGNLPTALSGNDPRNNYYMDINGGSDMGGVTYQMNTSVVNSKTNNLGSAFATGFSIQYTDSNGQIQEIRLSPTINQEIPIPAPPPNPPNPPNPPSCCC